MCWGWQHEILWARKVNQGVNSKPVLTTMKRVDSSG